MKLLLHDLDPAAFAERFPGLPEDVKVIGDCHGVIHPCIGCFGCWIKTPGVCVWKDFYQDMGKWLTQCDSLVLLTRVTYGGYSPFVKNCMDRIIGGLLPFFTKRNGEMHHETRYKKPPVFRVYGYGDTDPAEQETFRNLVEANALNLNTMDFRAVWLDHPPVREDLKEAL